jgi:hypothetical protein
MRTYFFVIMAIELLAYSGLGWVTFFGRREAHIPVSYIVLHVVAAIHLVCLLASLATYFMQDSVTWHRAVAIGLSLPSIAGVAVAFVMKMLHRWT